MLVLGRRWWLVFCMASLPPRNSLCQNFTCVFDSVDSPYCARNLRQISLDPTFSLVRNFITTCCAIVIGTSPSLILNSTNWGGGRVLRRGEEGPYSPPHHRTRSFTQLCSFAGGNWQRLVYIWSTYVLSIVSNFLADNGPHKILLYLWSVYKMPLMLELVNN